MKLSHLPRFLFELYMVLTLVSSFCLFISSFFCSPFLAHPATCPIALSYSSSPAALFALLTCLFFTAPHQTKSLSSQPASLPFSLKILCCPLPVQELLSMWYVFTILHWQLWLMLLLMDRLNSSLSMQPICVYHAVTRESWNAMASEFFYRKMSLSQELSPCGCTCQIYYCFIVFSE